MENIKQLKKEIIRLQNGIYEMDYFLTFSETDLEKIETDDEVDEFIEDLINTELSEIEGFKIIVDELKLDFEDKHMQCIDFIKKALEWVDDEIKTLDQVWVNDEIKSLDLETSEIKSIEQQIHLTWDYYSQPLEYEVSLYFSIEKEYLYEHYYYFHLTDMIEAHSHGFLQQHLPNVECIDEYDALYKKLQSKIKILNNLYEYYLFTD